MADDEKTDPPNKKTSHTKTALVAVATTLLPLVASYAAHVYSVKQEALKAQREAELRRLEFDSERRAERNADLKIYVPALLSEDSSEVTYGVTMLTVLYPDEAGWVLEKARTAKESEVGVAQLPSQDVTAPVRDAGAFDEPREGDRAEEVEEALSVEERPVYAPVQGRVERSRAQPLIAQAKAVGAYEVSWWTLVLAQAPERAGLPELPGSRVVRRGGLYYLLYGEFSSRAGAERAMLDARFDELTPEPVMRRTFCPEPKGSDPVICD